MNVLLILMPAALTLGGMGLLAFLWSLRTNQYDDLDGEAERILFEDGLDDPPNKTRLSDERSVPRRLTGAKTAAQTEAPL